MTDLQYFRIAMTLPPKWLRAVADNGPTEHMSERNIRILQVALRCLKRRGIA